MGSKQKPNKFCRDSSVNKEKFFSIEYVNLLVLPFIGLNQLKLSKQQLWNRCC